MGLSHRASKNEGEKETSRERKSFVDEFRSVGYVRSETTPYHSEWNKGFSRVNFRSIEWKIMAFYGPIRK